jgi:hypothetical protein
MTNLEICGRTLTPTHFVLLNGTCQTVENMTTEPAFFKPVAQAHWQNLSSLPSRARGSVGGTVLTSEERHNENKRVALARKVSVSSRSRIELLSQDTIASQDRQARRGWAVLPHAFHAGLSALVPATAFCSTTKLCEFLPLSKTCRQIPPVRVKDSSNSSPNAESSALKAPPPVSRATLPPTHALFSNPS